MEETVSVENATSNNTKTQSILSDERESLLWKGVHGTMFLLGGICFIAGSCMYFTTVYQPHPRALIAGGWLFTIGSACFLVADLLDLSHYLRIFYVCCAHRKEYENSNTGAFQHSRSSFRGLWERVDIGINVFLSVCGSIFYLIGSIFFIPELNNYAITGDWLFIIGSAFIFSSQFWKVHRTVHTNSDDRTDHRFHLSNVLSNVSILFADTFTGLGGVFYFVGTILFLPRFNVTDSDENRASILFVVGGCCFTVGGFILQYMYYCRSHK